MSWSYQDQNKQCQDDGKQAKWSDSWYVRKAKWDESNKLGNDGLITTYTGLSIVGVLCLVYFGWFVRNLLNLKTKGSTKEKIYMFTFISLIIATCLIIAGMITFLFSLSDQPKPTKDDFVGCV